MYPTSLLASESWGLLIRFAVPPSSLKLVALFKPRWLRFFLDDDAELKKIEDED